MNHQSYMGNVWLGHTLLCLGLTPASVPESYMLDLRVSYAVPGTKSRSIVCKASVLPTILSFWPLNNQILRLGPLLVLNYSNIQNGFCYESIKYPEENIGRVLHNITIKTVFNDLTPLGKKVKAKLTNQPTLNHGAVATLSHCLVILVLQSNRI